MSLYRKALIFAAKKHAGQKRTGGEDYIIHPIRVSQGLPLLEQRVAALLHDTVEDTDTTLDEIRAEFGDQVAEIVDALTMRKGESYVDYTARLVGVPGAIEVKIADIADNMQDGPSDNAIRKSARAITTLVTV